MKGVSVYSRNYDYSQLPQFFHEIQEPIFLNFHVPSAPNPKTGRLDKIPKQPNGKAASSTDPATWCLLDAAIEGYKTNETLHGVGVILIPPMTCVDLDGLRNPETGELHQVAKEILQRVAGWVEISVSQDGLHIFALCETRFPRTKHEWHEDGKKRAVEIYQDKRFMALTAQTEVF